MSNPNNVKIGATAAASNAVYDKWAEQYDTCVNKTRDLDTIAVRCMMNNVAWNGKRVLEFGCGTGRHTEYFMQKQGEDVISYTAMDVSEVH